MMMFLSVFLAFCLSGFVASSQSDEIQQFAVWSEPDVVEGSHCGCDEKPIPKCGCVVDFEAGGKDYVLELGMTYIEEDNAIRFFVALNGKVLYERKFIAKRPSPICSGDCPESCICINFYNVSYGKGGKWGGCSEIYVYVGIRVLNINLGCSYLPVNQKEKKTMDKPIQSLLFNEMLQRFQGTLGKEMSDGRLKQKNPFHVLFKTRVEKDNEESDTLVFN